MPLARVSALGELGPVGGVTFLGGLAAVARVVVHRRKVRVAVVVAGHPVVDGVRAGLSTQVADPVVAREDARHDDRGPAGRQAGPAVAGGPGHRYPSTSIREGAMTNDAITDPIFAQALGSVLREAREAQGWTRTQAATEFRPHLDIAGQTIAGYEQAYRNITVDRLLQLCTGLGEDIREVIQEASRRAEKRRQESGIATDRGRIAAALTAYITPRRWRGQPAERAAYQRLQAKYRN